VLVLTQWALLRILMDAVWGLWGRMEGVRWCILRICVSVVGVRCARKVIGGEGGDEPLRDGLGGGGWIG